MRRARRSSALKGARRLAAATAAAALATMAATGSTQTAVANGDTRTLYLQHSHTGETIAATFRVNGSYDPAVLAKLNYFLRDWRNNDQTRMDPRLFDVVWEVYRSAGATQPIVVYSAYRSPETNAMLRRRSKAVAEYSQHMLGKAMDTTMPGMSMEQIREIGMKLQRGGVGYYSRENFVHLDVGNVRSWPRMNYDQLARLFPDGKCAHLASNGRTLPRYEEARAEIAARGGGVDTTPVETPAGGIFAWLFGGARDRQEQAEAARVASQAQSAPQTPRSGATQVAALEKPVRMSAAERRAAARRAREAPAVAAIETANARGEETRGQNRTLFAGLQPPAAIPAPQPAQPAAPAPAPAVAQRPAPAPESAPPVAAASVAFRPDARFASAPIPARRERIEPLATRVAAADATPKDKPEAAREGLDAATRSLFAAAPIPPGRPAAAAAAEPAALAFVDAPMPPARPAARAHLAALSSTDADAPLSAVPPAPPEPTARPEPKSTAAVLARAASLPVVITQGPKDQQALPTSALGYAAVGGKNRQVGRLGSPAAPEIVSARLDRSNFAELTSDTPAAESAPASFLGQALTGLRQAARVIPDSLSAAPYAGYKMVYGAAVGLFDYERFSRPQPPGETVAHGDGVKITDASVSR
ncbi:DUF882 domain-containing protein [Methylocella sp.]|uniref:DUF882 domain-containing protein n=1 Tax=Methylocella sp. TaxID=1978226 RepID=UPI003784348A